MKITGSRIRELRQKNNLTLDDVAQRLGVGRQAIYKYEQGTVTNIPLENLEKMALLFNVTPCYLAGWTDDPSNFSSDHPSDSSERKLIVSYRLLSPRGKNLLLDRAEELKLLYGKKSQDDTAQSV